MVTRSVARRPETWHGGALGRSGRVAPRRHTGRRDLGLLLGNPVVAASVLVCSWVPSRAETWVNLIIVKIECIGLVHFGGTGLN